MNSLLKILAFSLVATTARAADTLVPPAKTRAFYDAWSFGAGLGLSTDAELFKFTGTTPTLFSMSKGRWGAGDYSIFADLGGLTVKNVAVKDEARLQPASSLLVAVGLEAHNATPIKAVSSYSQLGLAYLNASGDLAKTRDQLGGKLGIGFELPVGDLHNAFTDHDNAGVLFAEYQLLFGFRRADRLAGSPDLVDGSSILIGGRTYY